MLLFSSFCNFSLIPLFSPSPVYRKSIFFSFSLSANMPEDYCEHFFCSQFPCNFQLVLTCFFFICDNIWSMSLSVGLGLKWQVNERVQVDSFFFRVNFFPNQLAFLWSLLNGTIHSLQCQIALVAVLFAFRYSIGRFKDIFSFSQGHECTCKMILIVKYTSKMQRERAKQKKRKHKFW